ncbi:hypothetical protein [Pedococcus bigeumensis]|uniref:hypothetical protein n=1 Tax=Pedococcus bigeumensis TaxID=433644 RepID=UPI001128F4DB|nr:hypothetical protein [Pedococcus bigeumensis]
MNFLASNHERLLTNAVGGQPIHAPSSVETEVLRKARRVPKFKAAAVRWAKMKPNWLHVLPDDSADPALMDAALVLLPTSLDVRLDEGDDLGETMVVLHAYVKAMTGQTVVVIIDDRAGRAFARKTMNVVMEAKSHGAPCGAIHLTSTVDIIAQRLNTADIPDRGSLRRVWAAISPLDDGLPNDVPAELLTHARWTPTAPSM